MVGTKPMLIQAGQALAVDQQPMLACWPLAVVATVVEASERPVVVAAVSAPLAGDRLCQPCGGARTPSTSVGSIGADPDR
jgi:hypothetical protein